MAILLGIFEEGLIYAIMALGVYITYKILDFPDLSVDGTFPLGAALTAGLIVNGVSPVWALPLSFFAGVLAGCVTGVIHAPAPGGGCDRESWKRKGDVYRISDRSGGGSRDRGEGDHPCGVPDDEGRGGAEGEP